MRVRPLGPVILKDVKAALAILDLVTHVPSISTRDIHTCLHIARGKEWGRRLFHYMTK